MIIIIYYFNNFKKWGGAVATITPHKEEDVWGVLWELDMEHMSTLDRQEGVPKVYNRIHIEVCDLSVIE